MLDGKRLWSALPSGHRDSIPNGPEDRTQTSGALRGWRLLISGCARSQLSPLLARPAARDAVASGES